MAWIRILLSRCVALFRKQKLDEDLDEELRTHLDLAAEENMLRGLPEQEARTAALRTFGGVTQARERYRAERTFSSLDEVRRDIHFGLRMLRQSPGFTWIAVLTLALGIGASTALFSVADSCLRRDPEWYRDGAVIGMQPQRNARMFNFSIPEFVEMSSLEDIFDTTGVIQWFNSTLTAGDHPDRVGCTRITRSVISMNSEPMYLGRNFLPEEDRPGGASVAILDYEFWRHRYGGDPSALGKTIRLDDRSYSIVGVTAPHEGVFGSSVMVPLQPNLADHDRTHRNFWVVARLKKGITWKQANLRLNVLARQIEREYRFSDREYAGLELEFWNIYEANTAGIRPALVALLAAVGLIVLICCANVANLTLVRATARRREFTIRAALGARRLRIIRQMLTECVLLALIGGGIGVAVSLCCLPFIVHLIPQTWLPVEPERIHLNFRVLCVVAGLSTLSGVIFGIVPALNSANAPLAGALKESANRIGGDRRSQVARRTLVAFEISSTFLILVGAVLMIQGYNKLEHIDLGFRPEHILSLQVSIPSSKYSTSEKVGTFFENSIERVRSIPGVSGVAVVSGLPMLDRTVDLATQDFTIEGRPLENGGGLENANYRLISSGYFDLMGAHMIRGRALAETDRPGRSTVAVINQTMAQRYWPDSDPIGHRIHLASLSADNSPGAAIGPDVTIVGIVSDIKQIRAIDAPVRQEFYLPEAQFSSASRGLTMMVRSSADPSALTVAIQRAIASIDAEQPIYDVETMDQVVADSFGPKRIVTVLLAFFAAAALILSALGIYAVVSYSVGQRTHEIGVRRALGAAPLDILKLILNDAARLTAASLGIGLLAAVVLSQLAANLNYGVSGVNLFYDVNPLNPLVFVVVATVLFLVVTLAAYIPARRAASIDPMQALRAD
jgi:putative ABC transport system permease protein